MGILERLLRQEWSKSHGISYSVLSEITTTHGRIEVSSGNSTCYPNTHCNSNPPAKIEGQPILFILHLSGNYTDLTTSPTPRGEAATPLFIDNITWQSAPFPKIMISATPVNSAAASRIINLGVDQEWARETNFDATNAWNPDSPIFWPPVGILHWMFVVRDKAGVLMRVVTDGCHNHVIVFSATFLYWFWRHYIGYHQIGSGNERQKDRDKSKRP